MTKIVVFFYSTCGTNHGIAVAAAEAAEAAGAEVRLRRIADVGLPHPGRDPTASIGINRDLVDPFVQPLRRAANLHGHRPDRGHADLMLPIVARNHLHSTLAICQ